MAGLDHQVHGELDLRIGCATQRARLLQIIPITMKRAISVRKAALMIATVWNTSVPDKGFMSCLASCEAPGVNHLGWKMFRFQTQVGEMRAAPASKAAWGVDRSGSDRDRVEPTVGRIMSVMPPTAKPNSEH